MIQQFFKNIVDIQGVEAVVLYDNQNSVIDSWAIPKYNPAIFTEVGETYLHAFGMTEYLKYEVNELTIPFERGLVYARSHPRFYLVIIAKTAVEVPLLRMAANVSLYDFVNDRKMKKKLKKLPEAKFFQIKSVTLDDVEKIMLENILEERESAK